MMDNDSSDINLNMGAPQNHSSVPNNENSYKLTFCFLCVVLRYPRSHFYLLNEVFNNAVLRNIIGSLSQLFIGRFT